MTFAARTLGYAIVGAGTSTFTVVNGLGTNSYARGTATSYFYGWCPYSQTQGSTYPDYPMGSCSTTNPGLNSLAVIGVYSVGLNLPNNASYYYLLLAGNVTTGITSLTIGGSCTIT